MLDKLGTLVDPERTLSEQPLRALAREVHTYFSEHAKRHHADEEEHIFPRLLDSADTELRAQVEGQHPAREAIGRSVYGVGDEPLEVRVLNALRRRGLSVAVGDEVIDGTLSSRLDAAATRLPD
jgi:hypothetical protein